MNRTRYAFAVFVVAILPGSYLALGAKCLATTSHDFLRNQRGVGQRGRISGGLAGADAADFC